MEGEAVKWMRDQIRSDISKARVDLVEVLQDLNKIAGDDAYSAVPEEYLTKFAQLSRITVGQASRLLLTSILLQAGAAMTSEEWEDADGPHARTRKHFRNQG